MNIELLLFWKSRKLRPLKPAKITISPPTTDRIAITQRRSRMA